MTAPRHALLVGNSDGIGLATTRRLLDEGWTATGLSRSPSIVTHDGYDHHVIDVRSPDYDAVVKEAIEGRVPDVCLYCVGIGEDFDSRTFADEVDVFAVNLDGLVRTLAVVVPAMVARGSGHVIGLSSIADDVVIPSAPSYSATKAGFSNYLNALGFRLRKDDVAVTNVRFGFVDTKMAKSDWKPMMMTPERAADLLMRCIAKRPMQLTAPKLGGLLTRVGSWVQRVQVWFG